MAMQFQCVVFALLHAIANAALFKAKPTSVEIVDMQKVAQVESKLAKVLQHTSGLPASLVAEARKVDTDAAKALRGSKTVDKASLEKVLSEFTAFTADLARTSDAIKHHDSLPVLNMNPANITPEAFEHAEDLVVVLEAKLKKVEAHLTADKSVTDFGEATVLAKIEHALAGQDGESAFDRAVALHKALEAAHDYLAIRAKNLDADRQRLSQEISDQQATVLFMMLRQRRKLPMKAQMALLRRHQFKDCTYAMQLLKKHSDGPLDDQLLAMLPAALAQKLAQKEHVANAGHLDAAGSDGRVQIVSSRMKNAVKNMAAELTKAKKQLEQISQGNSTDISPAEKKQAAGIIRDLEAVLEKEKSSHDLQSQMEAMDEVQTKLKGWMLNAMKQK
jgi:hypothetical protein